MHRHCPDYHVACSRFSQLMAWKHGIFDDAVVSLIASNTASHVCSESQVAFDSRRFRANIEVSGHDPAPFSEDDWVGKFIVLGETSHAPAVLVTKRDVRCKMIGLDPDTAEHNPSVLKTAVRLNDNNAGVYGSVVRVGNVEIGADVFLVDHLDP